MAKTHWRRWRAVLLVGLLVVVGACSSDEGDAAADDPPGESTAETTAEGETADDATADEEPAPRGAWQKVAAPPTCQCSDGSPYHYWVRRADPQKVLFYMAGGGACFSAETCSAEGATYTVALGEGTEPGGGIFDFDEPDNPFADHSVVVAPYCTGDLHLGTAEHDYGGGVVVQHDGADNASTAIGAAAAVFPDADEVVVAGSSAGSAPAPAYGGIAHDLWPDADIAVVADASAAYPGDPGITLAIGSLWGVTESIPPWPETADLPPEAWSLPGLFSNAAAHAPELRFATYNDAYDEVQGQFSTLIGVDPSNLVELIDENNAAIEEDGVDLVSWVSPGTEHTILGTDGFYDEEVDGERFVDWLTAFLAGDEVDDVHCTDCEKPG